MPRGKKTVEEPSGDATPVKQLLKALEADRKRQQEEEKKRSEEHRELMQVLVGLAKGRGRTFKRDDASSEEESGTDAGGHSAGRAVVGKEPTLTKFSEKDTDVEHFLTGFERVATAYKWPDEMWVLKLVPLLTGRVLAAYANMDQEAAKDYGYVKKAILRRFDINKETYQQRFRTMKKAEIQSYIELGVQLKDLLRKWTAVAKDNPEELAEITVMEQLQNNMPRDLQVWIYERNQRQ
uniref:SCAN box domain-containing protein n=1 Tax=Amphimedon queenslandica TaxID=400682 RepID=A0A1X7U6M9_AMPQE